MMMRHIHHNYYHCYYYYCSIINMFDITIVVSLLLSLSLSRRRAVWGHSCHILPFQQIVWNSHFPSELVRTAKTAPNLFQIGVGYGNHAAPGRGNQRCSHHCSANQHREKSTERLGVTVAVFGMKTTLSMSGGSWTIWAILCEVCVCVCVYVTSGSLSVCERGSEKADSCTTVRERCWGHP